MDERSDLKERRLPKSNPKKLLGPLQDYLDPFWVSGLAVLCLLLGGLLWGAGLGLEGERLEWSLYLTLGTVFPALLLVFALPTRFSGSAPTLARALKLAFAVLLVVVAVVFVLAQRQYYALLASAAHLLLIYALRRAGLMSGPASIAASLLVVVVSWTAVTYFVWWSPYDALLSSVTSFDTSLFDSTLDAWFSDPAFDAWFLDWRYRVLVFFLSLLLVFVNLYPKEGASEESDPRFRLRSVPNLAALLVFGVASVRSDQLFYFAPYIHWWAYVGPAEMVRQGGWLLWDVPSQYGFLSTLAIASLPFESVWQSMYVVNSLLVFFSALFLFFLLRSLRAGFANFCFALCVTLAAVFLLPGWAPELLGPQFFPSQAAFRFFWVYALLGVLVGEFRAGSEDPRGRILLAGSAVWLVGTLWSAESAVYCAAVWLPAYALLVLRKAANARAEEQEGSLRSGLRAAVAWLAVPPLLLSGAVGVIAAYYAVRLGHLPDWGAFFEYSASFSSGFGTVPIELGGPVLTLFLVFCAFSTVAARFLGGGLTHRALALVAGTWGALWATSSYFVPRSYDLTISSLSPILCVAIGVALYLFARHQRTGGWATMLVRTSFVPVLTVILTVAFGNAAGLATYLVPPHESYMERAAGTDILSAGASASEAERHPGYEPEINSRLPVLNESLLALLETAQVKTDDPIVYYAGDSWLEGMLPAWPVSDGDGTRFLSPPRTWLPTMPFVLFEPLPNERKKLYMSRFIERSRSSGWLVQKKDTPYTSLPWFSGQLQRTHEPTEVFENADWQLTWFEYSE